MWCLAFRCEYSLVVSNTTTLPKDPLIGAARMQMLSALFDALPDAVIYMDCERRIVACNPALTELFGYAENELIGQSTRKLYVDLHDFHAVDRELVTFGPTSRSRQRKRFQVYPCP